MKPLKLHTIKQLRAALEVKRMRRPVSTNKKGFLKAGCKWPEHDVARVRSTNVKIAHLRAGKA